MSIHFVHARFDDVTTEAVEPNTLSEYFQRIGYSGMHEPTGSVLANVHRAHVGSIPFENLTIVAGQPVELNLTALQHKLIRRRRGGYCYEHNLLFTAMLRCLGFGVSPLLARIGDPDEHPRPRTHLVLLVTDADQATWLCDVGFGSGLLTPLPFLLSQETIQGAWKLRLSQSTRGVQLQQQRADGDWTTRYTIADEDTFDVDVIGANHISSTSPTSPFTQQIVVVRRDEQQTTSLIGRELSVEQADGSRVVRMVGDHELADVLAEFGIELDDIELAAALDDPGTGS